MVLLEEAIAVLSATGAAFAPVSIEFRFKFAAEAAACSLKPILSPCGTVIERGHSLNGSLLQSGYRKSAS
jgi:hypothetical protein